MLEIDVRKKIAAFELSVKTTIETNGITAIFGPSGSGKSTLLNIIAGFDQADSGSSITFNDSRWLNEKKSIPIDRRGVGYVTQTSTLFDHLTVERNLLFAAKRSFSHQFSTHAFELSDICRRFKLQPLLNRLPKQLSGGETQRVIIARALLSSPRIILLDEALNALDTANKEEILSELASLRNDIALPLLYVTHNLEELMRLADNVLLMEAGKLISNKGLHATLEDLSLPISHDYNAGVVIQGVVAHIDVDCHLITLQWSSTLQLQIASGDTELTRGDSLRVRIHAKDISITLSPACDSSILNIIPARIADISHHRSGQTIVKLICDHEVLLARITTKSARQLNLCTADDVFAQIKGVAILGSDTSHNLALALNS